MYGENHSVQLDSSNEIFNMLDSEDFISIISDLEEVRDQDNAITIYDYFGSDL